MSIKKEIDIRQYEDILYLEHHQSPTRPHMSNYDRAAQFSPFAALSGYEAAINETARLTDEKLELDEEIKADLNRKLRAIVEHPDENMLVEITYFQPDERKEGGAYRTLRGGIKKIDEYEHTLVMRDKTAIPVNQIIGVERCTKEEII